MLKPADTSGDASKPYSRVGDLALNGKLWHSRSIRFASATAPDHREPGRVPAGADPALILLYDYLPISTANISWGADTQSWPPVFPSCGAWIVGLERTSETP